MKWIYILIVLVIAAAALGCVDKKATESTTQTSVPQGDTASTPASVATSPEASSPANGEDIFGTESDLSAMNTTFSDMNMEISLLDSI